MGTCISKQQRPSYSSTKPCLTKSGGSDWKSTATGSTATSLEKLVKQPRQCVIDICKEHTSPIFTFPRREALPLRVSTQKLPNYNRRESLRTQHNLSPRQASHYHPILPSLFGEVANAAPSPKPSSKEFTCRQSSCKSVAGELNLDHIHVIMSGKQQMQVLERNPSVRDYYEFQKAIAKGSFGIVYLAHGKGANASLKFAIKEIKREKLKGEGGEGIQQLKTELQILKSTDNPNIIKFYEAFEDEEHIYIVMEFAKGRELLDFITENKEGCDEKTAGKIIHKIVKAANYLHNRNICHRDFKPENIILQDDDPDSELKLIDFGLSKKFSLTSELQEMKTVVGTAYYIAPEVLEEKYDFTCDMWSIGVITYLLLVGYPPFSGNKPIDIYLKIIECNPSYKGPGWDKVSKEALDFVQRLLQYEPEKRMTAEECINHPWMQKLMEQDTGESDDDLDPNESFYSLKTIFEKLSTFRSLSLFKREVLKMVIKRVSDFELKGLTQIFRQIDRGNTGLLTFEDLSQTIAQNNMQEAYPDQVLCHILEQISLNPNHKPAKELQISYSQFIMATMNEAEILTRERLFQIFKHLDTNDNNELSVENLVEAFGRKGKYHVREEIVSMLDEEGFGMCDFLSFEQFESIFSLGLMETEGIITNEVMEFKTAKSIINS